MFLLLLLPAFLLPACLGLGWDWEASEDTGTEAQGELVADPPELNFGQVALGSRKTLTLSVSNRGNRSLSLQGLSVDPGDSPFSPGALSSIHLGPDEALFLDVTFEPQEVGEASASLLLESTEGKLSVPLRGEGAGPELEMEAELELGEVWLGCSTSQALVLRNAGLAELDVGSVSLEGPETFTLELEGNAPWTIEPGEELELGTLSYAPQAEGEEEASVLVDSNDPDRPRAEVAVRASGSVMDWQEDRFSTGDYSMDVLFAVDTSSSMEPWLAELEAAFPSFFETLRDAGRDFHLAAVVADDGCFTGEWIDGSLDTETAAERFSTLLEGGGGELAEQGFELLWRALSSCEPGECNEGFRRDGARLHLVGVSDEQDRSPHDYSWYLSSFRSLVSDPADVYVYGIGGPYPADCEDVEPYLGFYEASHSSGGTFVSICSEDLPGDLAGLADDMAERSGLSTAFTLSREPLPETIEVEVDGRPVEEGWSYDEAENRVLFDEDSLQEPELSVTITYAVAGDCEARKQGRCP